MTYRCPGGGDRRARWHFEQRRRVRFSRVPSAGRPGPGCPDGAQSGPRVYGPALSVVFGWPDTRARSHVIAIVILPFAISTRFSIVSLCVIHRAQQHNYYCRRPSRGGEGGGGCRFIRDGNEIFCIRVLRAFVRSFVRSNNSADDRVIENRPEKPKARPAERGGGTS